MNPGLDLCASVFLVDPLGESLRLLYRLPGVMASPKKADGDATDANPVAPQSPFPP